MIFRTHELHKCLIKIIYVKTLCPVTCILLSEIMKLYNYGSVNVSACCVNLALMNNNVVGLLKVYSSLILNTQTSYDISLLYRIFGLLLKEGSAQCNLDWSGLHQFFTTTVNSLRFVY